MSTSRQEQPSHSSLPPRPTTERGNVRGLATRHRILSEAERLFAEHGISAVPLRDIGKAAGQRNHAAVQYHFGDRDEVVRAIMEFRGAESESVRAEMVTELMMSGGAPTVEDVVATFVRPLALHFAQDNHYLPFLAMFVTAEGGYEGLFSSGMHAGAQVSTLRVLLGRLVSNVPASVLDERWWLTLTSAVHALARYHTMQRKRDGLPAQLEVLIDDLIAFLSAGLSASAEHTHN